jgi:SIT4 phosphatase-associated protein
MGHLTLIAEEVLKLAERVPLERLDPIIVRKLSSKEWNEYVHGTLAETRTQDNAILGGVRPQPSVNSGLNLSVLGSGNSEFTGAEENVLAALVDRGGSYENGNPHLVDEFDEDREDRDGPEEPVANPMHAI